jgi:hypothetical protein
MFREMFMGAVRVPLAVLGHVILIVGLTRGVSDLLGFSGQAARILSGAVLFAYLLAAWVMVMSSGPARRAVLSLPLAGVAGALGFAALWLAYKQ